MSVLDLFRTPRILRAELVAGPLAISGGRTALALELEGAGVLLVGDVRHRFWRGFRGTVLVRVADQVGAPIAVRVRSLVGKSERAVRYVPLPPLPAAPAAMRARPLPAPRAPTVRVQLPSFTVYPRGLS